MRIVGTDSRAVSVAGVTVTNSRGQTVLRVNPNEFPANTFRAQKEQGDDTLIDYVQVGDTKSRGNRRWANTGV
jgi:Arf-GAP/SH3 domain/ANK repeat/PH domain-containing protein